MIEAGPRRAPATRWWVAGLVALGVGAGITAATGFPLSSPTAGEHEADLVLDPVRAVYDAGDPRDAPGFDPASLPSDLADDLLGDGPLDPDRLAPLETTGEVVIEGDHAHVVAAGDGTLWCVTEDGAITYDCMLAWQFTTSEPPEGVRAATRLRYYPDRTVVVVELVNDGDRARTVGEVALPPGVEQTAATTLRLGPPGALAPAALGDPWEPGHHALVTLTLSEDARAWASSGGELELSWDWGTVHVSLLETTWLLGPEREGAGEDHEH